MKNLIFLTATLFLALIAGCIKQYPAPKSDPLPYPLSELPPPTQEGKRTFGCLINGEPWDAKIKCPMHFPDKLSAIYDPECLTLEIRAENLYGDCLRYYFHQVIYFTITNPVYGDIDIKDMKAVLWAHNQQEFYPVFKLDTLAEYNFKLTKWDLSNEIVSGIFDLSVKNTKSELTWHLSEGRFDIPVKVK